MHTNRNPFVALAHEADWSERVGRLGEAFEDKFDGALSIIRVSGEGMAKRDPRGRTLCFGFGLIAIGVGGIVFARLSTDLLPPVGAMLLGFIIGMLVAFFVQEAKEWTRSALTASVSVLTGAGSMALLHYGAPDPQSVWFYPIGLVIGFGFGTIWEELDPA
jgi:O-antigen/teichoic acid export membrane protein